MEKIDPIITFIRVVETGSFTAATELLSLSKSIVSHHVSVLEKQLNTTLLTRTTRKLTVTEMGETFYQQVKDIPELVKSGIESLNMQKQTPTGNLQTIMPPGFGLSLVKDIIPEFITRYPQCKLQIKLEDNPLSFIDQAFDLMIYGYIPELGIPDYPLVAKKLFKFPIGIFATPTYLNTHGHPHTPEDLLQHNCYSPLDIKWPFKDKNGKMYRLQVDGNFKINNDAIVKSMVMRDFGICYAYPILFAQELKQGKVKQVLTEYTDLNFQVIALYPQSRFIPLKSKCFIDLMFEYYQDMQTVIIQSPENVPFELT